MLPSVEELLDVDWLERTHAAAGMQVLGPQLRRGSEVYGGAVTAVADAALSRFQGMLSWTDETAIRHALPYKLSGGCWSSAPEGPLEFRRDNLSFWVHALSPAKRAEFWAKMRTKGTPGPPPEPLPPHLPDLRLIDPIEWAAVAHKDGIWASEVSLDGKMIATASRDGDVALWDLGTGLLVARAETLEPEVRDCVFAPDGQTLVSLHSSGRVTFWHVPTLRRTGTFDAPCKPPDKPAAGAVSSRRWRRLAVSPDSAWLAVATWSSVELWDLETHRQISTFVLDPEGAVGVFALSFTPERQLCVVGHSFSAPVVIWDVTTRRIVDSQRLKREGDAQIGLFTPDLRYLVTAGDDIEVYRMADCSCTAARAGVNIPGRALAVAADGTRVATFGGKPWSTLRVLSLPNLTDLASWNLMELGCWNISCALAFTPAASIVAAGWDGVLRTIGWPSHS